MTDYDRQDSGMKDEERGTPYTIGECREFARGIQDKYTRELVWFLIRRVTRLEDTARKATCKANQLPLSSLWHTTENK